MTSETDVRCPHCGGSVEAVAAFCKHCGKEIAALPPRITESTSLPQTKPCQYCGEQVLIAAVKCKHCHSSLNQATEPQKPVSSPSRVSFVAQDLTELAKDAAKAPYVIPIWAGLLALIFWTMLASDVVVRQIGPGIDVPLFVACGLAAASLVAPATVGFMRSAAIGFLLFITALANRQQWVPAEIFAVLGISVVANLRFRASTAIAATLSTVLAVVLERTLIDSYYFTSSISYRFMQSPQGAFALFVVSFFGAIPVAITIDAHRTSLTERFRALKSPWRLASLATTASASLLIIIAVMRGWTH